MTMIRVIDLETTGMTAEDAVCEVGWQDYVPGSATLMQDAGSALVDPGRPIPPEAMAVHHIRDADVAGAPTKEEAFARLMEGADVFAAHNAAFERQFFGGGDKPWICTLKAARRVWPEAPGHGNQVLRYWLDLAAAPDRASPAHRAGPDAYVTALLLNALIAKGVTIDDLIRWTGEPSLLPRITFGKHRGLKWSEAPIDYLDWIVGKSEMDEDVKFTARHELKRRASG